MPADTAGENSVSISPDVPHDTGGSDRQGSTGTDQPIRALATPFKRTSVHQLEDGDLLIKGVPMLASGTWTDSAVQTPLFYPEKTLSKYAGNWVDLSGWNRHSGGVPRRGTDKVAVAENPRYENGAVTADVRVFGFTQNGRDMQEMIKRKLISFVSVEHGGDERYNPATRQMESASITFHGFAFVNRGACKVCKLNEAGNAAPAAPITAPQEPAPPVIEEPHMDTKELEAAVAAAVAPVMKELEAVKAQKPAEVKVEIPRELTEAIGAMSARIEKLEKQPAPAVAAPASPRELGTPETAVSFDRKIRTVRGD